MTSILTNGADTTPKLKRRASPRRRKQKFSYKLRQKLIERGEGERFK